MKQRRVISGKNAGDIINQLNADLATNGSNDYHVVIDENGHNVELDIVSSPGGGAEGGYDLTTLTAELPANTTFRFSVYPEDFLTKIAKAFGMQDVKVGYTDFDERVIVKTNDEQQVKQLFADAEVRNVLQNLSGYTLHIDKHTEKEGDHLHLVIQRAITNVADLQQVLNAFYHVLTSLTKTPGNISSPIV